MQYQGDWDSSCQLAEELLLQENSVETQRCLQQKWDEVCALLADALPEIRHPILGLTVLAQYHLTQHQDVEKGRRLLQLAIERDSQSKGNKKQTEAIADACLALIRCYEGRENLTDRQRLELAEAYQQAVPFLRSEKYEDALAMIYYNLGRNYHFWGKTEQAVGAYKLASISFRRKLVGSSSARSVREYKERLADACFWIGCDSWRSRPGEAAKSLEESITIYTLLSVAENTDIYDPLLARSIGQLILLLLHQGKVEESEDLCGKLISLLEDMEKKRPGSLSTDLCKAYVRMGNIQTKTKGGDAPLAWYRKSLNFLEQLPAKTLEEMRYEKELTRRVQGLQEQ